jgi:hypothetical protein
MAVGYTEWTVLEHKPIEELAPNLWRVEGKMNERNRRAMTLARLNDGRIIVHNAIALNDDEMKRVDAWGTVSAILIPNAFHRQDAFIMHQRYPKAKVYAPSGAVKAAKKSTEIAGSYADVPTDMTVWLRDIEGIGNREGVMMVRSKDGVSAIFCDTMLNLPKLGGLFGMLLHPTGTLSVPRFTRLFWAKDKKALRSDLEKLAKEDGLARVIPGHGQPITENASATLAEAAARL